jgi:hypothetical protein
MKYNYKIFQLKENNELATQIAFRNFDRIKHLISLDLYNNVYENTLETDKTNVNAILENLYIKFNVGQKPNGYKGHSLSVSDIVYLNDFGYYFCDSFGFKKINL